MASLLAFYKGKCKKQRDLIERMNADVTEVKSLRMYVHLKAVPSLFDSLQHPTRTSSGERTAPAIRRVRLTRCVRRCPQPKRKTSDVGPTAVISCLFTSMTSARDVKQRSVVLEQILVQGPSLRPFGLIV
jgi:hypothetical protein